MKCELCHKAEAETAVFRKINGAERELFICKGCAAASLQGGDVGEDAAADGEVGQGEQQIVGGIIGIGAPMLPLMGMIMDAAFEIAGGSISWGREPKCKVCGITRAEYRKASRLGCPGCYESFAAELNSTVMDLQRTTEYKGRVPERFRHQHEMNQLEERLELAVAEQRYEEAIALRDRIREMRGGGDA